MKEEQPCVLDFEVTARVNLRSCASCTRLEIRLELWRLQPPGFGCAILQFSVLSFLFSVKAVLYSPLMCLLEESSVFVPLCDTWALSDTALLRCVKLCRLMHQSRRHQGEELGVL